jgi:hypothetical protein
VTNFTARASRASGPYNRPCVVFLWKLALLSAVYALRCHIRAAGSPVLEADQCPNSLRTVGATSVPNSSIAHDLVVRHCAQKLAGSPIVNSQENFKYPIANPSTQRLLGVRACGWRRILSGVKSVPAMSQTPYQVRVFGLSKPIREATSELEPLTCSLGVIGQALQGFARGCKCRIPRRLSLLRVAPCCTVRRSRWYQSGINCGIACGRLGLPMTLAPYTTMRVEVALSEFAGSLG